MYAWVTCAPGEGSVQKVLVLGSSLRRVRTAMKLVVMIPPGFSKESRGKLEELFDLVMEIHENTGPEELELQAKIKGFSLRIFDKCVYLSPNSLVLKNCDEIFDKYKRFAMSGGRRGKGSSVYLYTPSFRLYKGFGKRIGNGQTFLDMVKNNIAKVEKLEWGYCVQVSVDDVGIPASTLDGIIVTFVGTHPVDLLQGKFDSVLESLSGVAKVAVELCLTIMNEGGLGHKIGSTTAVGFGEIPESREYQQEPTAIVGMSFRLPGGNTPDDFWNLLIEGRNAIQKVPSHRWTREHTLRLWKDREVQAGFLNVPIDEFDAKFFGVSMAEATSLDPQQRLLHEVAWEALEDAGVDPLSLYGSQAGIFVGSWTQNYKDITDKCTNVEFFRTYMGNSLAAGSARLSHFFGTTGPSIATESGCSSAIVAVDMAVKALRNRETGMALACGVNLILHPFNSSFLEGVLTSDYICKTFDADADGFVRAEGAAVLVLKRMSDAIKDGDKIWGLIRGSAVTQEGLSKSLGTPTVYCESLAMKLAMEDGGVDPADVSYVETHGTGTAVGDPLEVAAINKAYYSEGRSQPLVIGSVKTNVGHTESVSGLTGMIKVLLSMKNEVIPPHLNMKNLNPSINLDTVPLHIPLQAVPWPKRRDTPRVAGVSSFGISGTDGHCILEEAPQLPSPSTLGHKMERPLHILKISAKSSQSFEQLVQKYESILANNEDDGDFANRAYSANTGRATFNHRAVIVARNREEAAGILRNKTYLAGDVQGGAAPLCFLFTGQGSQYPDMAHELYSTSPTFRLEFDNCSAILQRKFHISLKDALWNPSNSELLNRTLYSQTSIFCVEICLLRLWTSWGVQPDYVMGHSLGEFAAAVAANILSFEDAVMLVAERSRLIDNLPQGKMLVLKANKRVVDEAIRKFSQSHPSFWVDYAALNSPEQTVVAGESGMIEEFAKNCGERGLKAIVLASTHAFHSRHMDPMLEEYRKVASGLIPPERSEEGSPKYISGMEGKLVGPEEVDADYWVRHTREKVSFMNACKAVQSEGCSMFLEVGPHPVLSALTMMNMEGTPVKCFPSLRRQQGNWSTMLDSLGKLYLSDWKGTIDWRGFDSGYSRARLSLPTYPFNRKPVWVDIRPEPTMLHPLVGAMIPTASARDIIFERELTLKGVSWVQDHVIGNTVIFPGAGFLEMCLAAGYSSAQGLVDDLPKPRRPIALRDLKIATPLALSDSGWTLLQTVVKMDEGAGGEGDEGAQITIFREDSKGGQSGGGGQWISHASAKFHPVLGSSTEQHNIVTTLDLHTIQSTWEQSDNRSFYEKLPDVGLRFGPKFQSLETGWRSEDGILLKVKVPDDPDGAYLIHPIVADAMIQAAMLWGSRNDKVRRKLQVPLSIGEFVWLDSSESPERFIFCRTSSTGEVCCNLLDQNLKPIAVMGSIQFVETTVKLVEGMIQQQSSALPKIWEEIWKPSPGPLQHSVDQRLTPGMTPDASFQKDLARYNELSQEEFQFHQDISNATRLYLLNALYKCGWKPEVGLTFTTDELICSLKLVPSFTNYVRFFLRSLAETGALEMEEGKERLNKFCWSSPPPSPSEVELTLRVLGTEKNLSRLEFQLVSEVGRHLPQVLDGKISPLSILFPDNSAKPDAGRFYTACSEWLFDMCREIMEATVIPSLKQLQKDYKRDTGHQKPLRFLEVGSGTGAYTRLNFKILDDNAFDFEYYYTDISPVFFGPAEKEFKIPGRNIIFKKLNMEEDPLSQGFCPEYFDFIVACEVLHVAKDMRATLSRLRTLLKPGGFFQIVETICQEPKITCIFGLLEGYWRFEDFELRPYHATLNPQGWKTALEGAGLVDVHCSPSYFNVHGFVTARRSMVEEVPLGKSLMGPANHSWIILGGEDLITTNLQRKLEGVQRRVIVMKKPTLHPTSEGGLKKNVANMIDGVAANLEGIVYLWGLHPEGRDQLQVSLPFVSLCQLLTEMGTAPKLFVVTQGVYPAGESLVTDPTPGSLIGLARTMNNENPALNLNHLDLSLEDRLGVQADEIFYNLWMNVNDGLAFRRGTRYSTKLTAVKISNDYLALPSAHCDRFQLALPQSRQIADLEFTYLDHYAIVGDAVEVAVKAVALNFRDVFTVLKPIAEFETFHAVGLDFAGVVTKVGDQVRDKKVGDRVFGMRFERDIPLPSHVKVRACQALPLPDKFTFCEGATLPTVSFTVYYALVMRAKLKRGETILVHTASGGIGLTVIQLAKNIGAKVIATAGNARKRAVLKRLGVEHVLNSRTTEFGQQVLQLTGGRGVDVVLNSLTGPGFKETSLEALGSNGRFLELSALNIWGEEEVRCLRPDVYYHVVDFQTMPVEDLEEMGRAIDRHVAEGYFVPLNYERFDALNIRSALKYLQKAKHIGKIVCVMPELKSKWFAKTPLFNEESTYLVTGGLGGIGFEVVKWLLNNGGKHVVIASRSSPSDSISKQIESWNQSGKHVKSYAVDVGNFEQCRQLFQNIEKEFPPLRGLMHAAGVLQDATVENQCWDSFLKTYNPKVYGSWNLHDLSSSMLLEHFVLFSSMSATFGSPGQTNHSSANSFEDTLAFYRHSLGLPATAINWGNWGEVGVATEIDFPGVRPIGTVQGLHALEMFLRTGRNHGAVANIDSFGLLSKVFPRTKQILDDKRLLGETKATLIVNADEFWGQVDSAEERDDKLGVFKEFIKTIVRNILKADPSEAIDDNADFNSLGVDSLMMLEMKNGLQHVLCTRMTLTVAQLRDCNTVNILASKLVGILEGEEDEEEDGTDISLEELKLLIREDSVLPEKIRPGVGAVPKSATDTGVVLLTGVTGTLGPYLLRNLSRRDSISKVYCLIRPTTTAKTGGDVLKRLTSHLQGIHLLEEIDMRKVECLEGDLSEPRLGLPENIYKALSSEVDAIVHSAVRADHSAKYWKCPESHKTNIRTVNVIGTQRVLEFAVESQLKHVYFASSILTVTSVDEQGSLSEDWQDVGAFDDIDCNPGYPITKHIGEQLVRQGVLRGIPVKTFRLPIIGGDSSSGRCDFKRNHFLLRCLASMKLGMMSEVPLPITVIPVDHCADLTLDVFFHDSARPDVYNVVQSQPTLEQVLIAISKEQFGVPIQPVGFHEFVDRIKEEPANSLLAPLKRVYEDADFVKNFESPSAKSLQKYVENSADFYKTTKMENALPGFQDMLEPSEVVIRRDLGYLRESGVFKFFDIPC